MANIAGDCRHQAIHPESVPPVAIAMICLFLLAVPVPMCTGQQTQPDSATADECFGTAHFSQAELLYAQVAARNPNNYHAALRLGTIALLANRFDQAQRWLTKAIDLRPQQREPKALLAEAYCRQDDFARAAPLLQEAGKEPEARQMASFKGQIPYQVQGPGSKTVVKFVMTDPLPVVQVRVNGGKEVNFFIDTGGSQVVLDTQFAKELGVPQYGSQAGTFAGGKKAPVGLGRIDSLDLGDWTIRNVPVATIDTRQFQQLFGRQIDGILGTVLFYHFTTTMDYPHGQLILERKGAATSRPVAQTQPTGAVTVPFWLAGDHYMVAWGKVNSREPVLLFVDTGLVGASAKLTDRVIHAAGIQLLEEEATESTGAGGELRSVPFRMQELSLGEATQDGARGYYEGPFPWEHTFGFRLDGMIGHDFFRPYAVTFDFTGMRLLLNKGQ